MQPQNPLIPIEVKNLGACFLKTVYYKFVYQRTKKGNKLMKLLKCNQVKELSNNELLKDKSRTEISICGTITSTIQIPTKSNPYKFIRFITLEDETGTIDCVCFDREIKKFDKLLQINNQVIITGEKFIDREEPPTPIIMQNVKLAK